MARQRESRQQRGYDAAWYRLQEAHLAEHPQCVGFDGPCDRKATQADHIIPFDGRDDPLRLDPTNLQSFCIVCHAKKTAEDQRQKSRPGPKPLRDKDAGERHRERMARREREKSESVRDIGPLPSVQNVSRRDGARRSLEAFCKSYLPATFTLPFSSDHRTVIAKIERAVMEGGLFAVAMPRGSGKTSLTEAACLWAILYGYRRFVMLIGASADAATEMLESIKTELETNQLLVADFPDAVYPIQLLEGEPRRCKGQTYTPPGETAHRTMSRWSQDEIVFPTIKGSVASGAIVRVAGITGRIRGQKFKRPDGTTARPDFVIADDPQTDSSANSLSQCATRERTLAGAVLGLAGPGKKISGVMPCTVIRAGDVADRSLDPKVHPEWNGSRHKLLYSFPSDMERWGKYREIMFGYDPGTPGDKERAADDASYYYIEEQDAMDAGAVVAWPERFEPGEVSAVQNAMNIFLRDRRAFFAEYQNTPLPEDDAATVIITAEQIAKKLNKMPRGYAPVTATRITAAIDVQKNILFYAVCAWEENFTGYVLDYGTWPDQGRSYFVARDVDRTIETELAKMGTPIKGLEAQLYAGVTHLTNTLLMREWPLGPGTKGTIERCLIDAGYETDTIYAFCRQSGPFASVVMPSHGRGIGASATPIGQWKVQPGVRRGLNWVVPLAPQRRDTRYFLFDANFWKTFLFQRLVVPMGSVGCLSLFGEEHQRHRLFTEHLTSEYPVQVEGKGRKLDEWKLKPNTENHWLDCCTMNAAAASLQGVILGGVHAAEPERKPVKFSEQQKRARMRRGRQ